MNLRRALLGTVLGSFGSFLCFPLLSWAREKSLFSTVTFIKVPNKVSPTLNPDLMLGNFNLKNRDWDYWHKFKSIKTHFEKNGYLLHAYIVPTKNTSLFAVRSYWKSKEIYAKWLKCIDACKFKKELSGSDIHWHKQVS